MVLVVSNEGLDPYSYGYNRATPASLYMNASTLVNALVDMVSKNGNLLLDFGPKEDGTIDATEVAHLLEAGLWTCCKTLTISGVCFSC